MINKTAEITMIENNAFTEIQTKIRLLEYLISDINSKNIHIARAQFLVRIRKRVRLALPF